MDVVRDLCDRVAKVLPSPVYLLTVSDHCLHEISHARIVVVLRVV